MSASFISTYARWNGRAFASLTARGGGLPVGVKYFIRTQFDWMCIALGILVAAFQLAGIINMGIAHALIACAWLIAVFGVWLSRLWAKSRKHGIITIIVATVVFIMVDLIMIYLAEYQKVEHDPHVKVHVKKAGVRYILK